MTMITTLEGISYFALLQIRARLKIEIATGMKHSGGSTLAVVNNMYGQSFKRKQAALNWVQKQIDTIKDNQTPVRVSEGATS